MLVDKVLEQHLFDKPKPLLVLNTQCPSEEWIDSAIAYYRC